MSITVSLLPHERSKEIALIAEGVREDFGAAGGGSGDGISADKAEPEYIAKASGLTLSYGHYGSAFDGMLEYARGRFHIYCNIERAGHKSSARARFTLAHELGHYYIDEHRNVLVSGRIPPHQSLCEFESKLDVEREADVFACDLLMPMPLFRAHAEKEERGLAGILKLADRFGTSITSTAIRYVRSGVAPCAVMKWNHDGRAWQSLSAETYRRRFRRAISSADDLPHGCPTARALARESAPENGIFRAGSTASFWFQNVTADPSRDIILIEEAIALGRFGVLTLLYPDSRSRGGDLKIS